MASSEDSLFERGNSSHFFSYRLLLSFFLKWHCLADLACFSCPQGCEGLCQENRLLAVLHPWGLQWVLEEGNASWSGLRHAHSFRGRRWLLAHSRATAKDAGYSSEASLNVVPVLKIKTTCHEQPVTVFIRSLCF